MKIKSLSPVSKSDSFIDFWVKNGSPTRGNYFLKFHSSKKASVFAIKGAKILSTEHGSVYRALLVDVSSKKKSFSMPPGREGRISTAPKFLRGKLAGNLLNAMHQPQHPIPAFPGSQLAIMNGKLTPGNIETPGRGRELSASIETGVRAVDILCPLKRGGNHVIVGQPDKDPIVRAVLNGIRRSKSIFVSFHSSRDAYLERFRECFQQTKSSPAQPSLSSSPADFFRNFVMFFSRPGDIPGRRLLAARNAFLAAEQMCSDRNGRHGVFVYEDRASVVGAFNETMAILDLPRFPAFSERLGLHSAGFPNELLAFADLRRKNESFGNNKPREAFQELNSSLGHRSTIISTSEMDQRLVDDVSMPPFAYLKNADSVIVAQAWQGRVFIDPVRSFSRLLLAEGVSEKHKTTVAEIKRVFIEAEKREVLKRRANVPIKLWRGINEERVARTHKALKDFLAVREHGGYVGLKRALAECNEILRK